MRENQRTLNGGIWPGELLIIAHQPFYGKVDVEAFSFHENCGLHHRTQKQMSQPVGKTNRRRHRSKVF